MNAKAPPLLAKIAALIGNDQAVALIINAHTGGRSGWLYIPRRPKPGKRLVNLIGMAAAEKLAEAFGGQSLAMPKCRAMYREQRNAEALRMAADGMSIRSIAEAVGLTDRQVRNVLAK